MEQWFNAYSKWPAHNQLIFAISGLIFAALLLFLTGVFVLLLVHYVAIVCRGYPPPKQMVMDNPTNMFDALMTLMHKHDGPKALTINPQVSLNGIDWKEESKRCQDEEVDLGGAPSSNEMEATRLAPGRRK